MSEPTEEHDARAGHNQSLFREINDRVESLNEAFTELAPYGEWVCECADLECVARVEMTLGEYDRVRAEPNLFLVAADDAHVYPGVEVITQKHERYWLVAKFGEAEKIAVSRHSATPASSL